MFCMAARRQPKLLEAGTRAPDFRLEMLPGGEITLAEILAGGPALLAFFKISCPICQLTFPFLERIHAAAALRIFGISQNDAAETREFNREFGVTFPTLLDSEERGFPASERVRNFERPDPVPGGARRGDCARDRRLAEEGNGVLGRPRRRRPVPPGRVCAGMEGRLRVAQLGARRAATLE